MSDLRKFISRYKRKYKCRNCDYVFEEDYISEDSYMNTTFNLNYTKLHRCSKNEVGIGVQIGVKVTKWKEGYKDKEGKGL